MKRIKVKLIAIIFLSFIFLFFTSNSNAQLPEFNNFNPNYLFRPLDTNPVTFSWVNQPLFPVNNFKIDNAFIPNLLPPSSPFFPANNFQSGNPFFSNPILPSSPFSFFTQNKPLFPSLQPIPTTFPQLSPPSIFPWGGNFGTSTFQVMPWNMPEKSPKIEQVINESFNNQTIYLTKGNLIKIELSSNPSTGYNWFELWDHSKLSLYDHSYSSLFNGLMGAEGKDVWILEALDSGKASISFEYKRPLQLEEAPDREVIFNIVISMLFFN